MSRHVKAEFPTGSVCSTLESKIRSPSPSNLHLAYWENIGSEEEEVTSNEREIFLADSGEIFSGLRTAKIGLSGLPDRPLSL